MRRDDQWRPEMRDAKIPPRPCRENLSLFCFLVQHISL